MAFPWASRAFIYQQVTADSGNGATGLAGTYAVGPSIGYTWKNKLSVSGQWLYEFDVGNRFQGQRGLAGRLVDVLTSHRHT